ncbi:MAG: hypothetical protein IID51_08600 [Proteobacteria bacterium]|nr:hypothetical protein [Pseudomonadota bacterium]
MKLTRDASFTKTGRIHKGREDLIVAVDEKLRAMGLHNGSDAFDPVLLLSIIACECYDKEDYVLAIQAAKEAARYMRPQLQAVQIDLEANVKVVDLAAKKLELARKIFGPGITLDEEGNVIEPEAIEHLEEVPFDLDTIKAPDPATPP